MGGWDEREKGMKKEKVRTFFLLSYSTTRKTKSCLMFQSKAADKSVQVVGGGGG